MTSVEGGPEPHLGGRRSDHDQVLAGRALPPGTERWSSLLDRNRAFLDGVDFRGDPGQVVGLPATDDIDMESVLLVGLGPTADNEALRRAAGWAARSAGGAVAVVTDLHTAGTEGAVRAVTEGSCSAATGSIATGRGPNRRRRPVSCSPGPMAPNSTSRSGESRRRGGGSGARPGPRAGSRPISR